MTEKQIISIPEADKIKLIKYQQTEVTESEIYIRISNIVKDAENKIVLRKIASDEARHAKVFAKYTGINPKPNKWNVFIYILIARIFGITFAVKLLEKNEASAEKNYAKIKSVPEIQSIIDDEDNHEQELINMINEERLQYLGSIVLGLNDALVELTGALAGFTLALQSPQLVALTGTITGIAAALSMASSEFLSTRVEENDKTAAKAALYTGSAYFATVIILILPFLILNNVFISLGISITSAIGIIAFFNYYYSIVKDDSFKKRFTEMALISIGVATISFGIGYVLKQFMGIEA
ncbi:MAG: VIT1/CCC1 transporter family protein [Marinilabiliaceae bacterium]|nr:VIT1/CCC1 transporter family protein [Marinilabiliaceae bacterium]